jgi:hypothetical protein
MEEFLKHDVQLASVPEQLRQGCLQKLHEVLVLKNIPRLQSVKQMSVSETLNG